MFSRENKKNYYPTIFIEILGEMVLLCNKSHVSFIYSKL